MKKVILITGSKKQCGIYQYSLCAFEILKTSSKYQFELATIDSADEFFNLVNKEKPYAVIYNHHPATLSWLNSSVTEKINSVQIMIVGHESVHRFEKVDAFIHTDPTVVDSVTEYGGIPPITYYDDIAYTPPSNVLKIGTSGIGNVTKNITAIVDLIKNQLYNEQVIFNVHMTNGDFVDPSGTLTTQAQHWLKNHCGSNITVNFNNEFMSKKDLITWLNNNDINLFWYETLMVPGVSSSIDKALAAKKPIGVNNSSFFKHIRQDWNDLTIMPIRAITSFGIEFLTPYYSKWSQKTFLEKYEQILQSLE